MIAVHTPDKNQQNLDEKRRVLWLRDSRLGVISGMKRPEARIATLDGAKNVSRARRNAFLLHTATAAIGRGSGLAASAQCRTLSGDR